MDIGAIITFGGLLAMGLAAYLYFIVFDGLSDKKHNPAL
jgi:hypothetical protein